MKWVILGGLFLNSCWDIQMFLIQKKVQIPSWDHHPINENQKQSTTFFSSTSTSTCTIHFQIRENSLTIRKITSFQRYVPNHVCRELYILLDNL